MFNELFEKFFENLGTSKTIILIAALIILDVFIFAYIFSPPNDSLEVYFLDVGQGDSEFVNLPGLSAQAGGVQILIDGGPPNGKATQALGRIMPFSDRYIDLIIMTHAQLDHFGGLIDVLDTYEVGAFLWNGVEGTTSAFQGLKDVIESRNIPVIVLGAGDRIKYGDNYFKILSPNKSLLGAKNLNDTSIVTQLISGEIKILFTGDIGSVVERKLSNTYDLTSSILKVSHHGSKYSSSPNFLSAVHPALAVIQVGRNSYGHPTSETLGRLAAVGAEIFRTDSDGTVRLVINEGVIKIFK